MNILLLFPILIISIPIMIGSIHLIKDSIKIVKEKRHQKEEEVRLEKDKQWFYNKVWNANWENKGEKIDIRNIPQLSFEQWLIFYNSAPEHWEINLKQCDYACTQFCAIPNYKKGKIYIDTFWETPEDLYKFMEWQKNEYQKGDAAIFENERAKRLSKLAKCLKEDIGEKNKQVQKELDALEKEVAANMPKPKEEDPIEKYWREQREEQARDCHSLSEFLKYLIEKYPDYNYAETQQMITLDGTIVAEIIFVHKYKPCNSLKITAIRDEKTKVWAEKSTMG